MQNSLHSGTQQDKEIGKDLVDLVQGGDLVLRDMGYFIIAEFVLIAKLLASWLSRVPANVVITNHSGYRIEKILRACKNDLWDGEILLGEEEKHRCRLIAVRASPEVVRRNLKEFSTLCRGQTVFNEARFEGLLVITQDLTEVAGVRTFASTFHLTN